MTMKKFIAEASSSTLDTAEGTNQDKKKVVILGAVGGGKTTLAQAIASVLGKKRVELPETPFEVHGTVDDAIITSIDLATHKIAGGLGQQDVGTLYKEWTKDPNAPTINNSEKIASEMFDALTKNDPNIGHGLMSEDVYTLDKETESVALEQLEMKPTGEPRYIDDLNDHVAKVHANLLHVTDNLLTRAMTHDGSKFLNVEFIPFEKTFSRLRSTTYGTPEYKALLVELGPALDHHYENNDHHPEYFENGINDMDIFQLTEMLCDWKAAVERHADGNVFKSLEHNKTRFNIDDQLYSIMCNTMKRWND